MELNTRNVVVSIHDVSPVTWKKIELILSELAQLGVKSCSLLVIPNHHNRGHFLENKEFCSWLCAVATAGHEIVIHGYFHQRIRKKSEGFLQKFLTRIYTADEGEFFDLTEQEAFDLVSRAQAEFKRINLKTVGFIAPAWLCSNEAEQALRKAGLEYTTRLGSVTGLAGGELYESQSMVYSVRSGLRRLISLGWNSFLYGRLKKNALLRISIHPVDFNHATVWRQIRKYISCALEEREPITYEKWIQNQRITG